jgi:16S rRNA processing protein RimM
VSTPGDDNVMLEVGTVTRAHGLRGEVVVQLVTDRLERVAPGSVLTVAGRELEVVGSRRDKNRWLVRFAGVSDRDAAEALRGPVTAPALDDPDVLWAHQLIGLRILDGGIDRGEVVALQENPASDLIVSDSGVLVPLRFVTDVSAGAVNVVVPAGLFELGDDVEAGDTAGDDGGS